MFCRRKTFPLEYSLDVTVKPSLRALISESDPKNECIKMSCMPQVSGWVLMSLRQKKDLAAGYFVLRSLFVKSDEHIDKKCTHDCWVRGLVAVPV